MLRLWVLQLVLAPAPSNLSPEAAELNARAMQFYDAGQLARAADEFVAAYRSMPNARRDRAGREQLLGSMRSTLLALHAETGEAGPLCRLQAILKEHEEALSVAWPEEPNMVETRNARARHGEVTKQLGAYGPGACTAVVVAPIPVAPESAPAVEMAGDPGGGATAPPPAPAVELSPPASRRTQLARGQIIAGSVVLPLGLVVLGVLGGVAARFDRNVDAADSLHAELALRACTVNDLVRMRELLTELRRGRGAMIGLGVTGAALVSAGTALLVRGTLQRRRARLGFDLSQGRIGLTIAGTF